MADEKTANHIFEEGLRTENRLEQRSWEKHAHQERNQSQPLACYVIDLWSLCYVKAGFEVNMALFSCCSKGSAYVRLTV